jgi:taurine transport system permease protein
VAGLAALWWLATHLHWLPPLFLPTPEAVWHAFVDAWHGRIQGGLPLSEHLMWSAARVRRVRARGADGDSRRHPDGRVARRARLLDPLLEFYRPLPPLAYLPLVVIWFGIDETAKIVVIYLACFAPIAMAAARARKAPPSSRSRRGVAGRQLRADRALRGAAGRAAGDPHRAAHRHRLRLDHAGGRRDGRRHGGLGQMVLNASSFLRTDVVVMGIVLIGLIAWVSTSACARSNGGSCRKGRG